MQRSSISGQTALTRRPAMAGAVRRAAAPAAAPCLRRTAMLRVCASEGVQDLLARDRKRNADIPQENEFDLPPEVPAEPVAAVAPTEAAADAEATSSGRRGGRSGRLKSRQQRLKDMAASQETVSGHG
jgi:hypothetical protein